MKISEIKAELRELKETLVPLFEAINVQQDRQIELVDQWRERCRHAKVEEYIHYTSSGYDYPSKTDKKKKCLSCGLVEKAVEKEGHAYYVARSTYHYEILTAEPVEKFYGKEGNEYYFAPQKREALVDRFTK